MNKNIKNFFKNLSKKFKDYFKKEEQCVNLKRGYFEMITEDYSEQMKKDFYKKYDVKMK